MHDVTVSGSFCVHWFCCVWRAVFPWYLQSPLTLRIILLSISQSFLRSEGKNLMETIHLRLSALSLSAPYIVGSIFIHWRKKPLWWWLNKTVIYEYSIDGPKRYSKQLLETEAWLLFPGIDNTKPFRVKVYKTIFSEGYMWGILQSLKKRYLIRIGNEYSLTLLWVGFKA